MAGVNPEMIVAGRIFAMGWFDESGQNQVYVRPFPNVDAGRWQVSTTGGTQPLWARNGRELFYIDDKRTLMAVPVQTGGQTFSAGSPARVFDNRFFTNFPGRTYDVSPDGQRFLVIKDSAAEQTSTATPASMVVVLNWLEELKARTGTK